ncbi:aspartate aminotransferase family protein [Marivirga sp. S37H4]|uniref:Aspartate aminotransferase family protein n=1 Tax=Marivirga aurantiaca TaxID=2802615 RepID=A0A934WZI7_9BACT|nr:pyridoxal-dependent decarboxylase [Marivirga aurantiaca]MBK6265776.1 aspartate aminotransferase family protein [Marivirga aurantiaca]
MQQWKKLSQQQIKERIFSALNENVDYYNQNIIGLPASHLDDKVFYQNAPFLEDAPFLSTLIHNPNHIGCHTLGSSESFFKGTQAIEKEAIALCAKEILKGGQEDFDGYVASGGTEANMQAVWIYRNYFMKEHHASLDEIALISSADAHYSSAKASNVFQIGFYKVPVDQKTREINHNGVEKTIIHAQSERKKYFIVMANMMTTMFGSVDNVDCYTEVLSAMNAPFKLHVDGAYGGFFYPFAKAENNLNFSNRHVNSITLDAHKMLQAPYGTGIFLIRKNWMAYANTQEASYVEGEDYTLIGSRSGANAIAIWMILMTYGPNGWYEKTMVLNHRATWLCNQLKERGIAFYRYPDANIVTIEAEYLKPEVCKKYGLVPDNHKNAKWFKIVIMDHVTIEKLERFLEEV